MWSFGDLKFKKILSSVDINLRDFVWYPTPGIECGAR